MSPHLHPHHSWHAQARFRQPPSSSTSTRLSNLHHDASNFASQMSPCVCPHHLFLGPQLAPMFHPPYDGKGQL